MGPSLQDRAEGASNVFARDVLKLAAGTSVAQLLPVLATPLLTRFYSPAEIGYLAGFVAAAVLLATVATARYAIAVVLPADDDDAANLLFLGVAICLGLSTVCLIVLLFFQGEIARFLDGGQWLPVPYLITVAVLLLGIFECLKHWLTRRRHFGTLAKVLAAQSTVTIGVQLTYGYVSGGPLGLLVGYLSGLLLSTILATAAVAADHDFLGAISIRRIKAVAVRFSQFPRFDLPNAVVHNLSTQGVVLLLTGIFGSHAVGFYAVAERVLVVPFRFLTQSFDQVFYQKLAFEYNQAPDRFASLVETFLLRIIKFLTAPFLAAVVLLRLLVVPIFGQEWAELNRYVLILAPPVYFALIMTPLAHVLRIVNRQQVSLGLNSALFIFKMLAVTVGGLLLALDVAETLTLFAAVTCSVLFVVTCLILREIDVKPPTSIAATWASCLVWSFLAIYFFP